PDAFSPDAFSPDAFSPDAFSPDAFSPDAFSPDAFSPDAFSSAQTRSLLGVSAFNGTAGEGILINTWENDGEFYVRVRGRNGAFSLESPFDLEVTLTTGVCSGVSDTLPQSDPPVGGNYDTIILVDSARMPGDAAEIAAMQASLAALAANPDVNGVVFNVNTDPRVAAANTQADAFPTCPYAKNLVARSIKEIVDGYRELNPLQYIVIIGNDDVIPFFRHPDQALLANERNYVPPVRDNTASQASLKLGYVLSQDRYGAGREISSRSDSLPIPQLAVGRLVETPAEVIGMVDAYLATTNGVVATPTSALITGYDFLEDAALAVTDELEAGIGAIANTLIVSRTLSPQDPAAWTADDLRNAFLTDRHDIAFLAGHFSASSALAADFTTRMLASEVVASSVDMTNALIFSAGCHSGYNIVNDHGILGLTVEPDWAQAFAQKQATFIGGTGYQYGDTDFIEYSERLYLEFSRQLRLGTGPVAIGDALVAAKQVYLATTPQLRPLHEKALLESTLFGLPMLRIDLPAGRGAPPSDSPIVSDTTGFGVNPGLTLGLEFADVTVNPTLTTHQVELDIIGDEEDTVTATYLSGGDGTVTNPAEPILPLEMPNVSVPDMVLRGVGFRGGAFSDTGDILPLTGAAVTEIRGVHPPFLSNIFYPVQFWRVNYFGALADDGGATRVAITPAQYRSTSPASITGVMRQFNNVNLRLYYSAYTAESAVSGNKPALAAPPAISDVSASEENGNMTFAARVVGDPAAGIQEAWVTFTALSGPFAGQWQSLDLTQGTGDTTRWSGVLALNGTPPEDIQFIIQAVNGVGVVGSLTNLGAGFTSVPETVGDPEPTELALLSPPTSGAYGESVMLSAELMSDGAPLADQFVTFKLGGQQRAAVTDSNGVATATLALLGWPGDGAIMANFGGTAVYQPSSDTAPFAIARQATVLTIDPASQAVADGQTAAFIASLADVAGRPLGEKTVVFIIGNSGGVVQTEAVITDYAGRAFLNLSLPADDYTIDAYFGGVIPLPGGDLTLEDDRYLPATAIASLTVTAGGDAILYVSSNSRGNAGGVSYKDEDILAYEAATGTWSLHFDGSDVGLKPTDIDALHILDDDSILMSFEQAIKIDGFGKVDDSDIVKFVPTSLGEDTAGSFERYFDGSDVGLTKGGENVDAIGFTPDGRLVISALATTKVPLTGGGVLQAGDEQLIIFNDVSFGADTAGDWEMYFDGRDVELRPEDIWGAWIDAATGDIYLSLQDEFSLPGVSGDQLDIFICHPLALGEDTDCAFGPGLYFDGSEEGFGGNRIDAFAIRR
ncbi:MAG: Ig-like domain repeat protein, partial [Chloroflexi bacterium]|nr:Ig-like domain repeat protein [Chloroflexota bacterium]